MIEELWARRDAVEDRLLSDDGGWLEHHERQALMHELAHLDEALGFTDDGAPVHTGDPVSDYLIRRQASGEITPEDLELTPQEIMRRVEAEKRGRRRG